MNTKSSVVWRRDGPAVTRAVTLRGGRRLVREVTVAPSGCEKTAGREFASPLADWLIGRGVLGPALIAGLILLGLAGAVGHGR
jgi:hypothetical protein